MKTPEEWLQIWESKPKGMTREHVIAGISDIQRDALNSIMASTTAQEEFEMTKGQCQLLENAVEIWKAKAEEYKAKWHQARKLLRAANKGAERNAHALQGMTARFIVAKDLLKTMNQPITMPYTEAIATLEAAKGANHIRADLYETEEEAKNVWKEKNRQLEDAISLLKTGMLGGTSALISLVRQWGVDKGIIGGGGSATVESQFQKLLEEVDEIREGIEKKDQMEILDGIGDTTVVLILLADLAGLKFENCLLAAYDEIKGRTGKMVDGTFVKDQ